MEAKAETVKQAIAVFVLKVVFVLKTTSPPAGNHIKNHRSKT